MKGADEAFAATVTDAGTLSTVLLSESATTAPAAGAAPESVTVHVVLVFDASVVLLHFTEEIVSVCVGVSAIDALWLNPL